MADSHERSWIVLDASGRPITEVNEYLLYLHHLGRSPNTVRAYAHHLQLFHEFLIDSRRNWKKLALTDLATFVGWLRLSSRKAKEPRSDSTINVVLAAVGSFYEYQDRLGCRDGDQPFTPLRSKESLQAVSSPNQSDTISATSCDACANNEAVAQGSYSRRRSAAAGCLHPSSGSLAVVPAV